MKRILALLILVSVALYANEEINYFKRGKSHLENNRLDLAFENFKTASLKSNAAPEVFLYLAKTGYLTKRYKAAYKAFTKAFSFIKPKDRGENLFLAAESAAFSLHFNNALSFLKQIASYKIRIQKNKILKLHKYIKFKKQEVSLLQSAKSGKKQDLLNIGRFYKEKGHIYLAIEYYLKAFNAGPRKDARITNELAKYFLKKNMLFQAKLFFKKSLTAHAFDRTATYNLGKIYFNEGDYVKSNSMFLRMKRVDKSYIPYLYLGEIYANTPGASVLSQGSIVNEAVKYLKEAEKRGCRSERLYTLLSSLYRNNNEELYEKYARYARVFRRIRINQERLSIYRNKMKIQRLKELVIIFKNDKRLKEIKYELAEAYSKNEQFVNSLKLIKEVIIIDRSNYKYFDLLGYCHYKLGEYEKAIVALKKAILLNKKCASSYFYLSKIFAKPAHKNKKLYFRNLINSVKYSPLNKVYLSDLGKYYRNKNKLRNALKTYKRLKRITRKNTFDIIISKLNLKLRLAKLEKDFSFSKPFDKCLKLILNIRFKLNPIDQKIKKYLDEANRRNRFHKEILYYRGLYHYSLFCKKYRRKDIEKSIALFKKLIYEYPYFNNAYYMLGTAYLNGKVDIEKGLKILTECRNKTIGYNQIIIQNRISMLKVKAFDEVGKLVQIGNSIFKNTNSFYSLKYLIKAHKKNDKNLKLLFLLGEIYKKKGEFDKAIFYYTKATKLNVWNPGIFLALGNAYFYKFTNSPRDLNDFKINYNPDNTFPSSTFAISRLKDILEKARKGAIKAYKLYIQQRTPFIVHDLHPSNIDNLVRYLRTVKLTDIYLANRLGLFFLRQKKYSKAISIFKNCLNDSPNNKNVLLNLLTTYKKINNMDKVTELYKTLLQNHPRDLNIHKNAGYHFLKLGNSPLALEIFNKAYKIKKHYSIEIGLGKTYYKIGNLAEAEKYLLKATNTLQTDLRISEPGAFFQLALIKRKKGDIANAIRYSEMALTLIKKDIFTTRFNKKYKKMIVKIYENLSSLNLYIGKYRKAFNWLIEARIFDRKNKHKYEIALGNILFLNKRFKYALTYYKEALSIEKKNHTLLFRISICFNEIGQATSSYKTITRLYNLAGNSMEIEALLFYGDLLMKLKNYNKALKIYNKAQHLYKNDFRVYVKIGHAYKAINKSHKALQLIMKNIYNIKQRTNIYNFLAWYMAERNYDINKATLWAEKAVLMKPKNLTYLKTLSYLYYKSGKILKYFRINQRIAKSNTKSNLIASDFYNYFYSFKKACGYFSNKNYLLAIATLHKDPTVLRFKDSVEVAIRSRR